jgi:hypothetical protein
MWECVCGVVHKGLAWVQWQEKGSAGVRDGLHQRLCDQAFQQLYSASRRPVVLRRGYFAAQLGF